MKTLYFVFLVLLISYSALFAQDEAGKSDQKIQSVSAVNQTSATTAVASYDFTSGDGTQFYGGASAAVEVEPGVWAMIAGDTDASGVIDAADRSNTWNDRNSTGYLSSDVNLSGVSDAADRSITWNNRNKSSQLP